MKGIQLGAIAATFALSACLWLADVQAVQAGSADVVLLNGKIYTADPGRSVKQAVALSGKKILGVATDAN